MLMLLAVVIVVFIDVHVVALVVVVVNVIGVALIVVADNHTILVIHKCHFEAPEGYS